MTKTFADAVKLYESASLPKGSELDIVCRRLIESKPLNDNDLYTAIYYLVDEDYVNERHALMFFASKLA